MVFIFILEIGNSNFPLFFCHFSAIVNSVVLIFYFLFSVVARKLSMTGSIRIFEEKKFHSKTTYFRVPQGQTSRYDRLAQTPRTQDRCPHRVLPSVSESPETRVLLKIQCQWSFTEVCSRLKFIYTPKFTSM